MQITRDNTSSTSTKLTVTASAAELEAAKQAVVQRLGASVKVQGFRPGKAPANIIEKNIDQTVLQTEVLDAVINQLYVEAVDQEKLRPVAQPDIAVTKFVPFSALEFTATVEVVGDITLPDYKKIKLSMPAVKVTANEVKEVLDNLAVRGAQKEEVTRAAKAGDEVLIDFSGSDAKTKEPIDGADGKNYPLTLGSNSFIPGFEDELIGVKAGETKTFDITFPEDYGAATLQGKKATFAVTAHKVQEVKPAQLDDAFAASIGPFKTLDELKADIKKQLQAEREQEARTKFDNELLEKIAEKTKVDIPAKLIDSEIDRMEEQEKRDVVYRGQTWQEHLDAEGISAEEHREKQRPGAELRVKAGLVLGEIAEAEKIQVSPEELELRIQLLRNQYGDPQMQAELDKPENRRDIMSRMLTESTLDRLRDYATKA